MNDQQIKQKHPKAATTAKGCFLNFKIYKDTTNMEKEKDPRGGPNRGQGRKKIETGKAYNYKPSLEADKVMSACRMQKKALIDRAIMFYAKSHEILE